LNRFTCHTTNVSPPSPANAVSLENHCIYASSDRVLIENSEFYHNGNGYALQIKGKDDGSGSQPDHWIIRNTRFHETSGRSSYVERGTRFTTTSFTASVVLLSAFIRPTA
jgi:hypothetical protein